MRVFSQINKCQQKKKKKQQQPKKTKKQNKIKQKRGAPLIGLAKSIYYLLNSLQCVFSAAKR